MDKLIDSNTDPINIIVSYIKHPKQCWNFAQTSKLMYAFCKKSMEKWRKGEDWNPLVKLKFHYSINFGPYMQLANRTKQVTSKLKYSPADPHKNVDFLLRVDESCHLYHPENQSLFANCTNLELVWRTDQKYSLKCQTFVEFGVAYQVYLDDDETIEEYSDPNNKTLFKIILNYLMDITYYGKEGACNVRLFDAKRENNNKVCMDTICDILKVNHLEKKEKEKESVVFALKWQN